MRAQLGKNNEIIKAMFTKNVDKDIYDDETTTLFNTIIANHKCLTESEPVQEQQPEQTNRVSPAEATPKDIKQTVLYKLLTNDYSYVKSTLLKYKDNNVQKISTPEFFILFCMSAKIPIFPRLFLHNKV